MIIGQRTYKAAQERLNAYVREHSLRDSKVRNMVFEQVFLLPHPFSAEQLTNACAVERISKGTVYNTLNLLVDAGILQTIDRQLGQLAKEYEIAVVQTSSMEMVCSRCGRKVKIQDKAITRMLRERTYANFIMKNFSLTVYGECKVCRSKKSKEQEGQA